MTPVSSSLRRLPPRRSADHRPPIYAVIAVATLVIAALSTSPLIVVGCGAVLALAVALLWRPGELPLLLLPVIYQWSQVVAKPIMAAIQGVDLNQLAEFGQDIYGSVWFSLVAIAALSFGLHLGKGVPTQEARTLRLEINEWPREQVLFLAIGAVIVGDLLAGFADDIPSLAEAVRGVANVRIAGMFMLAYWCLVARRDYRYLAAVFGFEIVSGLTGFFADFRAPFLVLVLCVIAARPTFRLRSIALAAGAVTLMLSVAVFWTTIKSDYRDFVNNGTGAQAVNQPLNARLDFLATKLGQFDPTVIGQGLNQLFLRHSYVDFLSMVMEHVPADVPHENGARLWQAATHVFTPRIIFRNKPALVNDTVVTAYYTGLNYGNNPNVSISIGYLGELYIDFGMFGGIAAVFSLAGLLGFAVRKISRHRATPLLVNAGLCAAVALSIATFETALVKMVGGTTMIVIAAFAVQRVVVPAVMASLARRRRRPRDVDARFRGRGRPAPIPPPRSADTV